MEGRSVENSGRASSSVHRKKSLWPCSPVGARPQVRAGNVGHKAGRLGTWALATSSLLAHYRVEGHRNIQSHEGKKRRGGGGGGDGERTTR